MIEVANVTMPLMFASGFAFLAVQVDTLNGREIDASCMIDSTTGDGTGMRLSGTAVVG